ncbi:ankyrin repeat domain-containing protein [Candidatus Dependentiae bacterium]|nr:ankyrin repeat domain-containing protein [Candidatus Dependentiae bacterium]
MKKIFFSLLVVYLLNGITCCMADVKDQICQAIIQGNLNAVKDLILHSEIDINSLYPVRTATPLLIAVRWRQSEIAHFLLKYGKADIDACDDEGYTALFDAVDRNNIYLVKLLLKYKPNLQGFHDNNYTPLIIAVEKNNIEIVRLLIEAGALLNEQERQMGRTALYRALCFGGSPIAQLLIEQGADIHKLNYNNNSCLHIAAKRGCKDIVKLLLSKHADVTCKNIYSKTPFYYALKEGSNTLISLFIEHGVDVNAAQLNGYTPLSLAAENNNTPLVEFLLCHGATIDAESDLASNASVKQAVNNQSDCTMSAECKNFRMLGQELRNGIYPNKVVQSFINSKKQELFDAIKLQDTSTFKELLKHLFSLCLTDNNGNTLWHLACLYNNQEVLRLLLALYPGHKVWQKKNKQGLTPLEVAVGQGNTHLLKYILSTLYGSTTVVVSGAKRNRDETSDIVMKKRKVIYEYLCDTDSESDEDNG